MNYNQKIREGIESAAKGYLPTSREILKKENPALAGLMPKDEELTWNFNEPPPLKKKGEGEGNNVKIE